MIILIMNIRSLKVIRGDCEFYMMRGTRDLSVILQAFLCISDIIVWQHKDCN